MNTIYILRNADRYIMGTFTSREFAETFKQNTIEFQSWESPEVKPEAYSWEIDWFPING